MGVNYNSYVAILKKYMREKGICDADLKQYNLMLEDRIRTGMYKEIIGYYADALQASKDNKKYLIRYINNLREWKE